MAENKKQYSVEEVIQATIIDLSNIIFPPMNVHQTNMMNENVSVPIERAIQNLKVCADFLGKQREKEADQPDDSAPVVDLGSIDEEQEG